MKTKSKKISLLVTIVLALTMLFGIGIVSNAAYTTEYYYPSGTKFVKNIALCYYKNRDDAKNAIKGCCEVLVDIDLTQGTGGDYYVYMGYNTTTNPNEAIRGLRLDNDGGLGNSTSSNMGTGSCTFYQANSGANDIVPKIHGDGAVDLNKGAGGNTIRLFVTKDAAAGAPITQINVVKDTSSISGWLGVTSFQSTGSILDLNKGAGGDTLYMHTYSPCTTVSTSAMRSAYTNSASYVSSGNYTTESKNTLSSARSKATIITGNLDGYGGCSIYTQSTIDSCTNNINNAKNNLQTTAYLNASFNGGTCSVSSFPVTIGTASSKTVDVSSYTADKSGWTFLGWNVSAAADIGSKTTVTVGYNQTLYAIFSKTITADYYVTNGSEISKETETVTAYNTDTQKYLFKTLPASATYDGRSFNTIGWRLDTLAEEPTITSLSFYLSTENSSYSFYTVYAGDITLKYNANGGSNAPSTQSSRQLLCAGSDGIEKSTASFTVSDKIPTRTGYDFMGWADTASATTAQYTSGNQIQNLVNKKTIYAVWKIKTFTVRFFNYDGTQIGADQTIDYGKSAIAPDTPEKPVDEENHYIFDGWTGYSYITSDKDITATFTAAPHDWDDGVITTEPTCTDTGIRTYTCVYCGTTKTETVPAAGHTWGDWTTTLAATCHSEGSEERKCSVCDEKETRTIAINPDNHDGGTEVRDYKDATCTEDGYTGDIYCKGCRVMLEEGTVIPALGHKWGSWIDNGNGGHTRTCENDAKHTETENHEWNDGEVTKAPTCEETGIMTFTCKYCGAVRNEIIPVLGHNWGAWADNGDGTHTRVCANDESHTQTEAHNWDDGEIVIPATCTENGLMKYTCKDCGATKTVVIPFGHVWSSEWVDDGNGTSHSKVCLLDSNHKLTQHHDWDEGVLTPATYTSDGYIIYTCKVCGATKTTVIPALKHNWGKWIVTKAATCSETGTKTRTCRDCGETETIILEKDPNNHTGATEIRDAKAATCSEDGYTGDTYCKDCGKLLKKGTVIPKIDHEWDKGVVTVPATCTSTGIMTYTCAVSGETRTEVIPKLAHVDNDGDGICDECGKEIQTLSFWEKFIKMIKDFFASFSKVFKPKSAQ